MNLIATKKGFTNKIGTRAYRVYRGFSSKTQNYTFRFKETMNKIYKVCSFSDDVFCLEISLKNRKKVNIKVERYRELCLIDKSMTEIKKILAKKVFFNPKEYKDYSLLVFDEKMELHFISMSRVKFTIKEIQADIYDTKNDTMLFLAEDGKNSLLMGNFDSEGYMKFRKEFDSRSRLRKKYENVS